MVTANIRDTGADIPINPPYSAEELREDKAVQEPGEQFQLNIREASYGEPIKLVGQGESQTLGTTTGGTFQRILGNLPGTPGRYNVVIGGQTVDSISVDDTSTAGEGQPTPFGGQASVGVVGGQDALPDGAAADVIQDMNQPDSSVSGDGGRLDSRLGGGLVLVVLVGIAAAIIGGS